MLKNDIVILIIGFMIFTSCQNREIYSGDNLRGDWNISNSLTLSVDINNQYSLKGVGSSVHSDFLQTTNSTTNMIVLLNGTSNVEYVIKPINNHFLFYEYEGQGLDPGKPIGVLTKESPDVSEGLIYFLQGDWINIQDRDQGLTFENLLYHQHSNRFNETKSYIVTQNKTLLEDRHYLMGIMSPEGLARHQTLDFYIHSNNVISYIHEIAGVWLEREFYERKVKIENETEQNSQEKSTGVSEIDQSINDFWKNRPTQYEQEINELIKLTILVWDFYGKEKLINDDVNFNRFTFSDLDVSGELLSDGKILHTNISSYMYFSLEGDFLHIYLNAHKNNWDSHTARSIIDPSNREIIIQEYDEEERLINEKIFQI